MEVDDANLLDEQNDDWGIGDSSGSVGMSTPKRTISPSKVAIKTSVTGSCSPINSPTRSPSLPALHGGRKDTATSSTVSTWMAMNGDTMSISACMASDPVLQSSIYKWSRYF